ncbi:MAG: PD40 domain-containing protein [Myxococcales bacterium]|nr:PD40 domain-containing protein [Myxococcales bacterium]
MSTGWIRRGLTLSCALLVALAGCGEDKTDSDTKPADKDSGSSVSDGSGDGSGSGDGTSTDTFTPAPKENFWIIYGRRSRLPGGAETDNDLVITDETNPGAIENAGVWGMGISPLGDKGKALQLTKFSFKKAGGLNCHYGCILSQDFKYIAIATGPPTVGGFEFQLGILNESLEVFVNKFGKLKDVADLHFRGSTLYYSTAKKCFDTGKCQYSIMRRMMDASEEEKELTLMAPAADPDVLSIPPHTIYTGRFHVSEKGDTLVFLTPTIRSVKVWAWRAGNLTQLDYVCENPIDNQTCVGTGSQYNDNDGVGISPDGKTVVLFTIVGKSLRVRKYKLGSTEGSTFSNIVTVPGNNYKSSVCLNLKPWQHAEVRGNPIFSADGKTIYFLGFSDCAGGTEKPWTDIMSISVDKIGGKIGASDVKNWTNNPREHSPANRYIRSLSLSPAKKFFVFGASPAYDSSGDLITGGKRHEKDTEVYVMPIHPGAKMQQITNETAYATDTPMSFTPVEVL